MNSLLLASSPSTEREFKLENAVTIMSSLPESYQPLLQTITAAERISKLSGGQMSGLKHNDLIAFLIEEAQHQLINEQCGKITKIVLAAYSKSKGKNKPTNC